MGLQTPYPKLVYFAERHPRFDRAAFAARWRAHGALGMSLPRWRNIQRYAQCDPLPAPDPLPAAGADPAMLDCDGVALVWYRSEAALQAHVADGAAPVMKQDELDTFARPVAGFAALTDEFLFRDHPGGGPKLFLAVTRAAGLDRAGFRAQWLGIWGPRIAGLVGRLDPRAGYRQNHFRPRPAGIAADCVDEIAGDVDVLMPRLRAELAGDPDFAEVATTIRFLATEEHLLYRAAG